MVKELSKAILIVAALAALVTACTPAPATLSPEDIQAQVATQVAATVGAQADVDAAVAGTLTAQAPAATLPPTQIALDLPTATPIAATVTPFVVVSSGGGGGGSTKATYACSWTEMKPKTNEFSPGDAIDIVWIITNTGSAAWPSKKDLDYVSGTKFSGFTGQELPPLKPGDSVTVSFEGNAPKEKGLYGMQFKVEGGLCWPAINIQVGKSKDP
ncbi:MAG TPA: NBR1-Ig-like domain-containing protein [Anaerolineales bacterium]|nr:NBR1-Ig-like domain-containing protein [Anaerolineales bacterium]